MAAKGDEATSSHESLVCPLCLDVFEDATLLSCGHTFCRKCLKMYDATHQDLDHMVCPLCRSNTEFQENRVEGLPTNVMVNGLVDDYHSNRGGLYACLEVKTIKCTMCALKGDAVSFCKDCNSYMCGTCDNGHRQMILVFADHQVYTMDDINSGRFKISQQPERCPIHRQENRDIFCDECKIYICLKCVIVAHRDHQIKNQPDFEKELRLKVDELIERSKAKKSEFEKNIQNTEARRIEVHVAIEKLQAEVREAYDEKSRQLKENERLLLEKLESLQKRLDDDLDGLKAKDRHMIKSIAASASLVANDRLGCLEADSLAAHSLLCDELEQILKEVKDDKPARVVSNVAVKKVFKPAGKNLLALGEIRGTMATVTRTVDLRGCLWALTTMSDNAVIVGYLNVHGADKIDSMGNTSQFISDCYNMYGLAYQSNTGNTVVVKGTNTLNIYSQSGSYVNSKNIFNQLHFYPRISCNNKYEIIVANFDNCIMIYDPTINTQLCSITTKDIPWQAIETRSGAIIASTCNQTNPGKVTVYDRSGKVGDTLTANPGEYLYAAVDRKDRVYVANVNHNAGRVVITQYEMEGLEFKKICHYDELKLTLDSTSCYMYMVSLSSYMLAFGCSNKLYFIEV